MKLNFGYFRFFSFLDSMLRLSCASTSSILLLSVVRDDYPQVVSRSFSHMIGLVVHPDTGLSSQLFPMDVELVKIIPS